MIIKSIHIKKLFNTFDHKIDIKDSNLTILLGQNGLGKTAILTLINALFSYDFDKLVAYQYEELLVTLRDGAELKVIPSFSEEQETIIATISYKLGDYEDSIDTIEIKKNRNRIAHGIPLDKYRRVRPDVWSDSSTGEYYSTDEIISLNEDILSQSNIDIHGCPEWLSTIIKATPVVMIDTKRLQTILVKRLSVSRETVEVQDTILELGKDFSKQIVETKAKAASLAYDLDRTYPRRLLDVLQDNKSDESRTDVDSTMKQILKNLQSLETTRRELVGVGLMQSAQDEVFNKPLRIDKDWQIILKVLNMYIEDSKSKMDVYNEMSKKISLFVEIINKHYIKKEIKVTIEGLTVSSTITKEPIPLSKLSSGEQHLFILFYNLLFKCSKNSWVLMDEPEISLNISWQKNFVSDLMKIMELNPISIMMATHSPSIVRNYWDNTLELSPNA